MKTTFLILFSIALLTGCDRRATIQSGPPEKPFPPGATNIKMLDEWYFTYEFDGEKILLHRYYTGGCALNYDSTVLHKIAETK